MECPICKEEIVDPIIEIVTPAPAKSGFSFSTLLPIIDWGFVACPKCRILVIADNTEVRNKMKPKQSDLLEKAQPKKCPICHVVKDGKIINEHFPLQGLDLDDSDIYYCKICGYLWDCFERHPSALIDIKKTLLKPLIKEIFNELEVCNFNKSHDDIDVVIDGMDWQRIKEKYGGT